MYASSYRSNSRGVGGGRHTTADTAETKQMRSAAKLNNSPDESQVKRWKRRNGTTGHEPTTPSRSSRPPAPQTQHASATAAASAKELTCTAEIADKSTKAYLMLPNTPCVLEGVELLCISVRHGCVPSSWLSALRRSLLPCCAASGWTSAAESYFISRVCKSHQIYFRPPLLIFTVALFVASQARCEAGAGGMEKETSDDRYHGDGAKGSDGEKASAAVGVDNDYHRLVEEQRRELEELERAARAASPSNK